MSFVPLSTRVRSWTVFVLGGLLLVSSAAVANGQPPAAENVNIITADGVRLKAAFYASEAKDPPTVIMLHPVNDKNGMKSPEWIKLAGELQKAKYSVIMFDFRGHGESTTIDDPKLFWSKAPNAKLVITKNREEIEVKDYIKNIAGYGPVLANDIAAVRAYLDRRNDSSKDCNTSSLIIIGADSGATLGALWLNSEWQRFKFTPHMNPMLAQSLKHGTIATKAEGNDVIGAVFLSISPTLEKRPVKVESLLNKACKVQATAAAFFCGKGDKASHNFAKNLESKLKTKNSKKHEFIGAVEFDTNLTGIKLLQDGLKTNKYIVDYLDGVVADRKVSREDKDFTNTYFVWRTPFGLSLARNNKSEKTLNFDDYVKFITP